MYADFEGAGVAGERGRTRRVREAGPVDGVSTPRRGAGPGLVDVTPAGWSGLSGSLAAQAAGQEGLTHDDNEEETYP